MKVCKTISRIVSMPSLLILLLLWVPKLSLASQNPFPDYSCTSPNVEFWKAIYSKYPTSQGVIHDSYRLDIVYEVIDLQNNWDRKARQQNREKTEKVKTKYENILRKLAQGRKAESAEEKRVRSLFGKDAQPSEFREAASNIRLQIGQKDVFREGVIRSGAYFDQIRQILKSYDLPEDLAYLPHVESSYNYKAYSKFGAAGIWQFIHSTGKRFMTIDYTLDERRDPIRATHAAAKLLKDNYTQLGSWPLAITAYNHGTNGMVKAKQSKGDYETIFNEYEGRLFKFASRNFYSEFLAAREVAKDYTRYFGPLTLDPPVRSREVELDGYLPVDRLLEHLDLDMATFRSLNLGLREPVYNGQKYIPKGYRLRLPERQKVIQLAGKIPGALYLAEQKRSSFYQVRRGDTAGTIARMHRISLQDLILANQLNSRATVYAGQNLRIPKPEEKITIMASAVKNKVAPPVKLASLTTKLAAAAKDSDTAAAGAVAPERNTVPQASTRKTPEPGPGKIPALQSVQATATDPAESQGQPPEDLSQPESAGNSPPEALAVAAIPQPLPEDNFSLPDGAMAVAAVPINPAVVTGNLQVEGIYRKNGKSFGVIKVEAEETLGHYAEWLGVRAQDLRRLNGLRFGKAIQLRQEVTIPLDKVTRERFEELRYEYHKEMEEDFFAAFRIDAVRHYTIKSGDNIWKLCQNEFELPFWLIRKYNADLDWGTLRPEQNLLIPVVEQLS
jgi:membrane-bound lytic murein transglycosylase D